MITHSNAQLMIMYILKNVNETIFHMFTIKNTRLVLLLFFRAIKIIIINTYHLPLCFLRLYFPYNDLLDYH